MANPRTRQELKDYCLRALGAPVIEINVDDQQVEDRIDEALRYFVDWNSHASEKRYYKYQVTEQDRTNGYINTNSLGLDGSNIISISRVFQVGFNLQMNNVFNVRYQMALNDFYGLRTGQSNMNFFVSTMQYVEMLQQLLDPEKQTQFSRYGNKLTIHMNWQDFAAGQFLLIEAYTSLDPDTYGEIYGDTMLKKYTTALIKRQWGANLSKYDGIPLPGNITFNGARIYQEALDEVTKIEDDVLLKYQDPPDFITG
jgi:hypothetical protein